jgi:hypothetical protein
LHTELVSVGFVRLLLSCLSERKDSNNENVEQSSRPCDVAHLLLLAFV